MATLHVRNVPDTLYEALRTSAEQNGRSIGSQAVALLNESLSTGRRGFPFFRKAATTISNPFDAFADEARMAVVDAQAIARELGQDHVGSEHLLLAILSNRTLAVARAVAAPPLELTPEQVRSRLERGPGVPEATIPFGPDAKKAFELGLRESLAVRSPSIGAEHLLLGIAAAGGPGAHVLDVLGATPGSLRLATLSMPRPAPPAAFKVVELEGGGDEWERLLNDAADGCYELVQIVGTRAIFQLTRPR